MHKWLHVNALWVNNRNVGYVLSMLEHDRNSQWLRGGGANEFLSHVLTYTCTQTTHSWLKILSYKDIC